MAFCYSRKKLIAVCCLVIVLVSKVFAGEIALKNGDLIQGELVEIQSEKLIWKSTLFGNLTVPKDQVLRIETKTLLKVRGVTEPCYWKGLMAADALFTCNDEPRSIPFLAIQQISKFEEHREITRVFKGKVFASGSQSTGNKIEESWIADVVSSYRYTDYRHDVHYFHEVKSIEDSPQLRHSELRYDFNWFFSPQTYWLWSVSHEQDEAKDVDSRWTAGAGLGYQLWESKRTSFSLETGAEQVEEAIFSEKEDQIIKSEYGSMRLSSKFRYLFPFDITFFSRSAFNQSLDVSDDWKVNTDTGLSLPFGFGISADIKLLYEFQNMPVEENRKEDTTLRFGLGYKW